MLFSPLTADLIGAMRPLLEHRDPAAAEFVASDLLGACSGAAGRLGMLLGADMEQEIAPGIAAPAWADAVENPPRLVRAMRAGDPYRDVDGLLLTFVRRGLASTCDRPGRQRAGWHEGVV